MLKPTEALQEAIDEQIVDSNHAPDAEDVLLGLEQRGYVLVALSELVDGLEHLADKRG